jgi:hypothetical protein
MELDLDSNHVFLRTQGAFACRRQANPAANSRLSEFDGRKTACLGGGKGIKFNAREESPFESPAAAL